jgi:hypothetical protein
MDSAITGSQNVALRILCRLFFEYKLFFEDILFIEDKATDEM